jgi:glycosyltransferase involved in cell wall biosynthesis
MSKPLVIISRNPDSYLSGHSIFSWQLSEFLAGVARVPVVHITHAAREGSRHSVRITPPVGASLYRRVVIQYESMPKVPDSLSSCVVADAVDGILREYPDGVRGVLAISPLSYLADVLNVCLKPSMPVVSLLRGTDTLQLAGPWGTTYTGRRYRRALEECEGIFTVSQWLGDLARTIDLPVTGVVAPVTFHPFSRKTLEAEARSLETRMLPGNHPAAARLAAFAGRMASEKGALKVAEVLDALLRLEPSVRVAMAGSGSEQNRVRQVLDEWIAAGRAWVGPLSFPEVLTLASRTDLMVMGSGLEQEESFTEAISSSSVTFASRGTPVLYRSGPRSGGIREAVGEENRLWCEALDGHEAWPEAIRDLFQDEPRYKQISSQNRDAGKAFEIHTVLSPLLTCFGIRLAS